jgi:hypothetical protein
MKGFTSRAFSKNHNMALLSWQLGSFALFSAKRAFFLMKRFWVSSNFWFPCSLKARSLLEKIACSKT